ncbi:hypothetical protein Goari_013293 [Gossypium aridum]|uniref:Uncharacterized protein n=1 Tax=Gossypium aridum TaxID=34290 RepID=A0A7J8XET9_GOSAI|nr:hypothetical protein [Gossypium aridum]
MGFSEIGNGCKDHPNHQQMQGVCASCLRERLSRLCSASYTETNSTLFLSCSSSLSFSPAPDNSSPSSSTSASPDARHRKRNGSGVTSIMKPVSSSSSSSSSFMLKFGSTKGLKKSRSIACVARNLDDEELKNGKNKKKGFWSRLLSFKGKKNVLPHSMSMRLMIGRVN